MPSRFRALACLILCFSANTFAEYNYGPVSLSAFGTFGGAWLSNNSIDYRAAASTQPSGPGKSWVVDPALDSRLGAQLNISPTSTTLITAQAVAQRQADGQFLPGLTLANIRQEFLDDFAIRFGRIQSPIYLAAEYRLANFPNPWVRPPKELYSIYPLTQHDGVDLTYRHDTPIGQVTLNSGYGWYDLALADPTLSSLQLRDIYFVTARLDNGPWRLKLSMMHTNTTWKPQPALVGLLAAGLGPFSDPSAAQKWAVDGKGFAVYSAGLSYDSEDWLFMGEWGITLSDSITLFPEQHGGYLTAGYHIGRFMPQVTLSYQSVQNRRVNGNNPFSDAVTKAVFDTFKNDHHTVAFGLNYAATDNIIVRGQIDLIQPNSGSYGPYSIVDNANNYNIKNPSLDELVSLTVDFIY